MCLISGGKDSAFSILHCLANGHDVVALANLHPAHDANNYSPDDLDSYMYQTIGHTVIPLYEKALALPLYRQEILGSAINQDKSYGPSTSTQDDETESLVPLLLKVKAAHPEVNAVSTGAILSDYQRTRVESVAIRLGLTSLAYLWQYPFLPPHSQRSLLDHMAAVGQDSQIIKVASGALDGTFLWQNVADHQTINRLDKASRRFGSADDGAVLGEGGEYETLAVAGPLPLWKGRIVVRPDQREIIKGDAGSSFLRIISADLEMRDMNDHIAELVRTPPLLEPRFQTILTGLQAGSAREGLPVVDLEAEQERLDVGKRAPGEANGVHAKEQNETLLAGVIGAGASAEEQTRSIMDQVAELLQSRGCSFADVAYTSIVLRNMEDFLAVNAVYGTCFSLPNPPARVTIACSRVVPPDADLMISFTIMKPSDRAFKKGLHVQSRSYWAPANIGPYSQAIVVPVDTLATAETGSLVYISGQIPLIPGSMELATSSSGTQDDTFQLQCVLTLQHAIRTGRAMQARSYACAMAFVVADSIEAERLRHDILHKVWDSFHRRDNTIESESTADDSDDPSFDVWDQRYGLAKHQTDVNYASEVEKTARTHLPSVVPPLYVVRVDALPRNANVEWVTYGLTKEASASPVVPHVDHLLKVFKNNIVL